MATTLQTPTLNLNNAVQYFLVAIDLGPNTRDEVWVEPFGADAPVLAKVVNRKTKVTITLNVKGTSVTDLVTRIEAVRNQFNGQSNTLTYSLGGVSKVMTTYDSQIDPVDLNDPTRIFNAEQYFQVTPWTFSVTRDSKFLSDLRPPVV